VRTLPWRRAYGIALLTWPAGDLVVLDFDGPHAERLWRDQTGIVLPETGTNRTGGGWSHRLFTMRESGKSRWCERSGWSKSLPHVASIGTSEQARSKACGVDFLVNGYFIVPPTPGYSEDPTTRSRWAVSPPCRTQS